jgi:hypothetical protein
MFGSITDALGCFHGPARGLWSHEKSMGVTQVHPDPDPGFLDHLAMLVEHESQDWGAIQESWITWLCWWCMKAKIGERSRNPGSLGYVGGA